MDIELEFEEFKPLMGALIHIPENVHVWRGYSLNYPILTERPTYFGEFNTARSYAELPTNTPRELGCFKTTRTLRLLDYRFMRVLLNHLFQTYPSNDITVLGTVFAFGLCSFHHQHYLAVNKFGYERDNERIRNMINYYNNFSSSYIEMEGVRIAETFIDGPVMVFLSELFKDLCDGFISPRLKTPFHIEKDGEMSQEIIIFNPIKSGIAKTTLPEDIVPKKVQDIIRSKHREVVIDYKKKEMRFFINHAGGSETDLLATDHPLNVFNEYLEKNDPHATQLSNNARHIGQELRNTLHYIYTEAPHPSTPMPIWNTITDNVHIQKRPLYSPKSPKKRSRSRRRTGK